MQFGTLFTTTTHPYLFRTTKLLLDKDLEYYLVAGVSFAMFTPTSDRAHGIERGIPRS